MFLSVLLEILSRENILEGISLQSGLEKDGLQHQIYKISEEKLKQNISAALDNAVRERFLQLAA